MSKKIVGLCACIALIVGCGGGSGTTLTGAQLADNLESGTVATSLSILQATADRFGPLAAATDIDSLRAMAEASGCLLLESADEAGPHLLFAGEVNANGAVFALSAEIRFLVGSGMAESIATADRADVQIEATNPLLSASGLLELSANPSPDILAEGVLILDEMGGETVVTEILNAILRPVADPAGVIFLAGNCALTIGGIEGVAALSGTTAEVALGIDGVMHTATIELK